MQASPEVNMALLANTGELTRLTVVAMMNEKAVNAFFGPPMARENVYRVVMMAIHKKLEPQLRNMQTGQFNKSVMEGRNTSGQVNPNSSMQVKTQ